VQRTGEVGVSNDAERTRTNTRPRAPEPGCSVRVSWQARSARIEVHTGDGAGRQVPSSATRRTSTGLPPAGASSTTCGRRTAVTSSDSPVSVTDSGATLASTTSRLWIRCSRSHR